MAVKTWTYTILDHQILFQLLHCSHKLAICNNDNFLCFVGLIYWSTHGESTIIWSDTRNSYCYICAKSEKDGSAPAPPHECGKNWSGNATTMESDMVVEGKRITYQIQFLLSLPYEIHGLRKSCHRAKIKIHIFDWSRRR